MTTRNQANGCSAATAVDLLSSDGDSDASVASPNVLVPSAPSVASIVTPQKRRRPSKKKGPVFTTDATAPISWNGSELRFRVEGKPIAWARPKVGWKGQTYNPQKKSRADFAAATRSICTQKLGSVPQFKGVWLRANLEFHYPCAASNKKRENTYPKQADLDNLCKFVLDSLNAVLYEDDKQVVDLSAKKRWSTNATATGYTVVTLSKVTDEN